MKHMAEKGKIAVKKWGFRRKKWIIAVQKSWVGNQTRKAKWCKMQVLRLNLDKPQGLKEYK